MEMTEDDLKNMSIDSLFDLMTKWTMDISAMYRRKEGISAIRVMEEELMLIQRIIIAKKSESPSR